jgi:hypothetical protein
VSLTAINNALTWGMPQHPVYLWTLPMFHCNGWCFPFTVTMQVGGGGSAPPCEIGARQYLFEHTRRDLLLRDLHLRPGGRHLYRAGPALAQPACSGLRNPPPSDEPRAHLMR